MKEYLNETRLCWVRPVAASGAADDDARADEFIVLEVLEAAHALPHAHSGAAYSPKPPPETSTPEYSRTPWPTRWPTSVDPFAMALWTRACSRFMATISS